MGAKTIESYRDRTKDAGHDLTVLGRDLDFW